MRSTLLVVVLLLSGIATAAAPEAPRATTFSWMTGCWGYESGGSRYEEHWLAASGNTILGIGHRDADGYTRDFDYLRIVTSGTGFDLVTQPKGDSELRYGMVSRTATSAVFESLSSTDFPTRITYEFIAPDLLRAHLEGSSPDKKPMSTFFPMRKKSCTSN